MEAPLTALCRENVKFLSASAIVATALSMTQSDGFFSYIVSLCIRKSGIFTIQIDFAWELN